MCAARTLAQEDLKIAGRARPPGVGNCRERCPCAWPSKLEVDGLFHTIVRMRAGSVASSRSWKPTPHHPPTRTA